MRAGAYIRVSTTEQAEGGHSLDAQRDAIASFCEAKGWEVAEWYADPGCSGSTGQRPDFQHLLTDAEAGRFDVVICHAIDRFYRNLRGLLGALDRLNRAGVGFISLTENMDFTSSWGKLTLAVLGSLAEIYIDRLSAEVKKGKQQRARKGLTNATLVSHGYQRAGDQYVIDEQRALAVVVAFETYSSGEYSDQQLADLLNREGYAPPGWRADRWISRTVRYMLKNPFYAGWVRYGDDLHRGQHEAIISQDLWAQVQEVRARRNKSGSGPRTGRAYLLHRVGFCWHCKLPLYMNRNQERSYYLDAARHRGQDCPDSGRGVPMAVIDQQVAALASRLRLPNDWRSRLEELANHQQERQDVEGKRRYLQGKLRRLKDLYIEGDLTRAEYDRRKVELLAKVDALTVPEPPDVERAGETLESLGEMWASAPPKIQRDMLRTIFEAVYVDIGARQLVCVKPYPQFVPLFRMDGLEERENGCFYWKENEAGSED